VGWKRGVIPLVNLTSGGVTTTFKDSTQVLNTGGRDVGVCTGNESISWQRIGGGATAINLPLPPAAALNLTPFNVPNAVQGQDINLTVAALDGSGNPAVNLPVALTVSGANTQIQNKSTDTAGLVTFTYTGSAAGADSVEASAFVGGFRAISNVGSIVWIPPGGTNNPLGPSISSPSPADGSVITKPVPVDATIAPPSGHSVTSWRVFYQAANGGPAVVIGNGSGAPPSPLGVTLDPTVLADGSYTLTVEATADNGATQDVNSGVSVIGGLKLGRYSTTFRDMSVPVTGVQLEVQRTYDSIDTATSGDFGFGWRVSVSNFRESSNRTLGAGGWTQYNQSCTLGLCFTAFKNAAPRFVTVVYPNGHSEIFDFTPGGGTNIFWGCTPVFTARASVGTTSTLVPIDDTGCSYSGDGNIYGSNGVYNPQRFQLTTRDGRIIVLDHTAGLISMTDRNGDTLSVDTNGVHASNGQGILFTRDGSGRITKVTGPASGQTVTYAYSSGGDLATSTDPIGNTDTYTYDSAHHLLKASGPQGAISTETYDSSGRLISFTDASGHTTQIQNNVGAQSTVYTDAIGGTTTVVTADDFGDVVRTDVASGGRTLTLLSTYDSAGHVTSKTDALGHTVHAVYDAQGDLTSFTDGDGNTTRLIYDTHGLITSVIAPDGNVLSSAVYDANGNPTSMVEAGGAVAHFTYDASGLPLQRTDPAGNTTGYTYDSIGRVSEITDPAGKTVGFQFDAANRLAAMTDPLGNAVHYTYDGAGDLIGVTDARGNGESFTYNSFGSVLSATDPLGGKATVTYDADGNITSATDRAGNTTGYTYDADGRLTRITYPGGDFEAFTFDGFGRPTTVANSLSSIDNSYDAAGQLVTTTTHAPALGSASLSYTYDAAGNRLTSTGPDGSVSYGYDSRSRVVKVTDQKGGLFGIQYDSASRVTSVSRPNGITDSYTYDVDGRMVGITSTLGGATVQNLTQTFDANGQVASRTDASGATAFTHDADGRLVAVSGPGSVSQTYAYDAAGNRTSGPQSTASSYNAADELTGDSNFTYTYDAEGQRTSRMDRLTGATTRYTYNPSKQLISIQYPDGTSTSYTYDPLGRRLSVTSAGATTAYVYDGANTRLEYGSAGLTASYVGAGQVDRPLEMTRGASSYYYLQNFQGSVTALTDSSGSVAASYSYDAFGVPTTAAPSVTNPFTYTGREYDAKGGLYYNRARYYEPATGGFISQDPIAAGQRYAYTSGDPVDSFDPSGGWGMSDLALLYTNITTKYAQHLKIAGCVLSLLGAGIEIALDLIGGQPPNLAAGAGIAAGIGVACAFGLLGWGPQTARAILLLPILAGVIGTLVDSLLQLVCRSRGGGDFSWQHAVAVGLATLSLAAGAAVTVALLPEGASAADQFEVAMGNAIVTGEWAGVYDLRSRPGACG
jgi:RHS repeat-associated protein